MYLINISFHVSKPVYAEVLGIVSSRLLPAVKDSGLFTDPLIVTILVETGADTRGFALQMKAASLDDAFGWIEREAAPVLASLHGSYGDSVMFFTTPMEIIHT